MKTILFRQGSKSKIAEKILPLFPKHTTFVDMFFGAGGLFFKKQKVKYNICNDLDSDVFNLWKVLQDEKTKDEFYDYMNNIIHHDDLLEYWKTNNEEEPIKKAARFIFMSNFTIVSGGSTLVHLNYVPKNVVIRKIEETWNFLKDDVSFMNKDFRNVLENINRVLYTQEKGMFVYADPPYSKTNSIQYGENWNQKDTEDLFKLLVESGLRFAISEFDSSLILELVEKYELYITEIGERKNIGNTRNEILVTNYDVKKIRKKLF